MDAKQLKLYASFFLISIYETTLQLLEKEFERPQTGLSLSFNSSAALIFTPVILWVNCINYRKVHHPVMSRVYQTYSAITDVTSYGPLLTALSKIKNMYVVQHK